MRIVMRGSPRRWAVLSLVAILHLLLAMMLAHIMRESTPLVSNQAIQVQFVSVPETVPPPLPELPPTRSEEHTSELQSLMRISYAVFCLKKKTTKKTENTIKKAKEKKHV